MTDLQKFIGNMDCTIVEAMQKIDANRHGVLFIADETGRLKGCVTDGDIRRWIIKTGELTGTTQQLMNQKPKYLFSDQAEHALAFMAEQQITCVPIIDASGKIEDIIFRDGVSPAGQPNGTKALRLSLIHICFGISALLGR